MANSQQGSEAPTGARGEVYFGTHKALRWLMGDTLARLGRADPDMLDEVEQALAQVRDVAVLTELSVALDALCLQGSQAGPGRGAAQTALAQAAARRAAAGRLRALCASVGQAGPVQRGQCLDELYLEMAQQLGTALAAMRRGEARVRQLLAGASPQQPLCGLARAAVAEFSAPQLRCWLYWMVPALKPEERGRVLELLAPCLPKSRFGALLAMLEDVLPRAACQRLRPWREPSVRVRGAVRHTGFVL